MSTYVIGDIQGCFTPLLTLLEQIQYDPNNDELWFAGDLINRGSESLETLRFIRSLGSKAKVILGNHDLHLIAVSYGFADLKRGDTVHSILNASDRDDLLNWLRSQPLCHYDEVIKRCNDPCRCPSLLDLRRHPSPKQRSRDHATV